MTERDRDRDREKERMLIITAIVIRTFWNRYINKLFNTVIIVKNENFAIIITRSVERLEFIEN